MTLSCQWPYRDDRGQLCYSIGIRVWGVSHTYCGHHMTIVRQQGYEPYPWAPLLQGRTTTP